VGEVRALAVQRRSGVLLFSIMASRYPPSCGRSFAVWVLALIGGFAALFAYDYFRKGDGFYFGFAIPIMAVAVAFFVVSNFRKPSR
jgi:hypothetical protein